MDADMASPEPSHSLIPNPNPRPTTADSSYSGTMYNAPRRARSASTSSSATNFPSSHDAFGLAASPSAYSPKHSWLATRPTAFPPAWGNGSVILTSGLNVPSGSFSPAGSGPAFQPSMDMVLSSPSQHSMSHGVLPSSTLMGGGNMRLNRPSLLSLQPHIGTGPNDDESGDQDGENKRDHETIEEEEPGAGGEGEDAGMDGGAAEFVKRWRNRLEPSPTIRRVQSACGTPRGGSQSPSSGTAEGSGSVSPTSRLPPLSLRRASSDQSTTARADFKLMLEGMRRGSDQEHGLDESDSGRLAKKDKGKGKEKMSYDSSAGSNSGEGEGRRSSMLDKRPSVRLPPSLRATLAAEKDIAGQEIRSEALLQRLILSNPTSLPITPRPSRYHRNRAMSTFSSALSQSSDSMSGDSSDDEGPFTADDVVERDVTPAIERGWDAGMEVDMMTPGGSGMGLGGPSSEAMATPMATVPMQSEYPFAGARRGPSGRSSMNSLSSFGGMRVDEKMAGDNSNSNGSTSDMHRSSMSWRESPSSATRSANKRKAAFDDTRYEPYGKRHRTSTNGDTTAPTHTTGTGNNGASLGQSPLQWHTTLPSVPISPMSTTSLSAGAMDFDTPGRSHPHPRSRAGSPATAGIGPMQMMTRPLASSPAMSSPLSHAAGNPPNSASGMGFGAAGPSNYRPIAGMGGLGMLLLSKRNANSMSTGMGLTKGDGDGETVVSERMGGMDFAGGGRNEDKEDEDKMIFD